VQCAVEAQTALAEANAGLAPDRRISFRIGVHIGDVMVRAGDLFGDGVNIAARLQALAKPGGVCISSATYDQVRKVLPITFTDLGVQQVKNIQEPVRAYQATAYNETEKPEPARLDETATPPVPDKPSIAVLPFQNMSGDHEQEYFADGIVEEIITALSRFKSLFVIARNSSFTYKGKAVDIKQVGRDLGVRYVLEGSVRKADGRVRITGQLIEASTGAHVWADRFDGELHDVFDLQDKITSSVVGAIAPAIEQAEIERVKYQSTSRLDSYEYHLKGRALFSRPSPGNMIKAQGLFKRALDLDPNYAAACVDVAHAAILHQAFLGSALTDQMRQEAIQFAETACRLCGNDDAAVIGKAAHVFAYLGGQNERAERLVEEAVTMNPNLAGAWNVRGWISIMRAEPQRAILSFNTMLRLSPLDPRRAIAWTGMGIAHFLLDECLQGYRISLKAVETVPDIHSLGALIINAMGAGLIQEAREGVARALEAQPQYRVENSYKLFPVGKKEWQERIANALREAGVPD